MEVILVVIAILFVLGILGVAKDHVNDNKDRWKRNIKNTADDLAHEAGQAYGKRQMRKAIEQDLKNEIAGYKKRISQIDRKIESYKKLDETGTMSKTERNNWKKLTKERIEVSDKLEDCGA